ncbi:hypothetical protein PanWU01x14_137760 [Parasponia andersonii]|uniref:Uncharacterized protein n=1 Tax=Parasponia andersonii TaxID=3476 RepID=A0A2P5CN78_PARAD|nr:hypothetical protein PanWU01x14_137760 [Parasponia andersonii]
MRDLEPSFSNLIVSFVPRQCHFFAHNVASWALTCNSFGELDASEVPESVWQDHVQWIFYQPKNRKVASLSTSLEIEVDWGRELSNFNTICMSYSIRIRDTVQYYYST